MKGWILPAAVPPELVKGRMAPAVIENSRRLEVYASGYLARVEEALSESYESIRQVLGRRAFGELARAYATAHPSRDYNLSHVGRHLPEFLNSWPMARELPFLPDLGTLEWAVARAFHAAGEEPLRPETLAGWPSERLESARVVFQPWIACVASAWPILEIWQARHQPVSKIRIELVNRPQRVRVFRQGLQVACEALDELQFDLLQKLLAGQPLGTALEAVSRIPGNTPPPLTDWFAHWAAEGAIVKLEVNS